MTQEIKKPFFSIVIPVCRVEQFLEQCLRSVQEQDFGDFECIVVNDGSTGVNPQKLSMNQDRDFVPKIDISKVESHKQCAYITNFFTTSDNRFKYVSQENNGASSARNTGIEEAKGEWLIFIDSDDWITSDHLSKLSETIINNQEKDKIVLPYFVGTYCYNTGRVLERKLIPKSPNAANALIYPVIMSWNHAQKLEIVKQFNLRYNQKMGPGPKREGMITRYGHEDTFYGAQYLEVIESRYGHENIKVINTHQDTYRYRDLDFDQKAKMDSYEELDLYRDLLLNHMKQSKLKSLQDLSKIYPVWFGLWSKKGILDKIRKTYLTLKIRFITKSY
jgi:glycosyltransferase involved in cell wall biosynthesis